MTEVLPINPSVPEPDILKYAGEILRAGGLIAYPTETVYGLAASAFNSGSITRVFEAKGRPHGQPLPVQIADISQLESLARAVPPAAQKLIADFFPGPLTLVLWRQPSVSLLITGGGETVGLRMPNHAVALGVLRAFGGPLVCPSANSTGRRAAMSASDVLEDLDGRIDLVLDSGPTTDRTPSTVLDITTSPARIVRDGKISRTELENYLPIAPQ